MNTVHEIKSAVSELSRDELAAIAPSLLKMVRALFGFRSVTTAGMIALPVVVESYRRLHKTLHSGR